MRARNLRWRVLAVFCGIETTVPPGQGLEEGCGALDELNDIGGLESEVRVLKRPTIEEFTAEMTLFGPNMVYFSAQPGDGADWIGVGNLGPFSFINKAFNGGVATPQPEVFASLFKPGQVDVVYFDAHSTDRQAELLHQHGMPAVLSWTGSPAALPAHQFARCFFAALRSPGTRIKEAYEAAQASVSVHCQKAIPTGGNPPPLLPIFPALRINSAAFAPLIPPCPIHEISDLSQKIKCFPPAAEVRLLLAGDVSIIDPQRLLSLTMALRSLMVAETRLLEVEQMTPVVPPAELSGKGMSAMRCDIRTASGASSSVLAGGPSAAVSDKRVVEHALRKQLVSNVTLLAVEAVKAQGGVISSARRSAAVAGGISVVEVAAKTTLWAVHVMRQLCQSAAYRGFVAVGVAAVAGTAVAAFTSADSSRLAAMSSYRASSLNAPGSLASAGYVLINGKYVKVTPGSGPRTIPKPRPAIVPPPRPTLPMSTTRPGPSPAPPTAAPTPPASSAAVPVAAVVVPAGGSAPGAGPKGGTPQVWGAGKAPTSPGGSLLVPSARAEANRAAAERNQHQCSRPRLSDCSEEECAPPLPETLDPIPWLRAAADRNQHHCSRPRLSDCSEEEFLADLMDFLNTRKKKNYNAANFPDVVLNGSKLDMFVLYREVVTRGGIQLGNGINWKGQVFNKMSNYTQNNRMTGVGNALKKHYDTYLKDYESAHLRDVERDICQLCGGGEEGGSDWVCCAVCEDWCHFDCDGRPGQGSFKDFAKENGPEYLCARCEGAKGEKREAKKPRV